MGAAEMKQNKSKGATNGARLLNPRKLLSDHITVLMDGYSESYIPLLSPIAATYAASIVNFGVDVQKWS